MSQPIRMVGMDLDGTLLGHRDGGPYVPPETCQMLTELIHSGGEAGIVTGRSPWDIHNLLSQAGVPWGQPFPTFICPRETFLYWLDDAELAPDEPWNEARVAELCELTRWIIPRQNQWYADIEAAGLNIVRWLLHADYGLEVGFDSPEEAERARQILAQRIEDMPEARTHRNYALAYVVIATGGKGQALLHAATSKGLAPEQVLAIGDSLNDLDMLDGNLWMHSGAVANADPVVQQAVRAAGGIVATEQAGAGVGEILRRYREKGLLG